MAKQPGIYRITNGLDGKVYIGSAAHIPRRLYMHKRMLGRGEHDNVHLQRAWDRDGAGAFQFLALEAVQDPAQLLAREQFWIDHYRGSQFGIYNIAPEAGSRAGVPQPASVAEKMRAVHAGKPKSAETRAKMSAAAKGRKNTPEQNEKIRAAVKKRFAENPDAREKAAEYGALASGFRGHKHGPEIRAKISAARKARPNPIGPDGRFLKKES